MKRKVLIVAVLLAVVVWHNFSLVRVAGDSMSPTIESGSLVLVFRSTKAERGGIVLSRHDSSLVVKRVIGLPCETIEFRHGLLFVDGRRVIEDYAYGLTSDFNCVLGKDEVFLIGDNREESTDSRNYGPVPAGSLKGRVVVTLG